MRPAPNEAIAAEGLGLVIGQYRGQANFTALLEAALEEVQELEDAVFAVLGSQLLTRTFPAGTAVGELDGPPDQALLQVADLVGAPRGNFTTRQLAFLVQVWILARASRGRSEDLLTILRVAFQGFSFYAENYPASFEVWAPAVADESLIVPLTQALTIARPPGVYAALAWGSWLFSTFIFGDSVSGSHGSGFNDSVGHGNPVGLLSAAVI